MIKTYIEWMEHFKNHNPGEIELRNIIDNSEYEMRMAQREIDNWTERLNAERDRRDAALEVLVQIAGNRKNT